MKFVLFQHAGSRPTYGVLSDEGVFPLEDVLSGETAQEQLQDLIATRIETLRPRSDTPVPLAEGRLLPPVPQPGKIVVTTAVYGPGSADGERQQLLATIKSAESVIGPGGTAQLPTVDERWSFVPQAGLGIVIRGPVKDVAACDWQRAVFGYTCAIDIMGRGDAQFGRDFWLAKADTLGPLGPCLVTPDEVADISTARVRSWQNGAPAQDYSLAEASHSIAEQVELVTTVMTLHSGDVLVCGSSTHGQRPLSDGERIEVEIDGVGRLAVNVAAPVASAI